MCLSQFHEASMGRDCIRKDAVGVMLRHGAIIRNLPPTQTSTWNPPHTTSTPSSPSASGLLTIRRFGIIHRTMPISPGATFGEL